MSRIEQLVDALTADAVAFIISAVVLAYFFVFQITFWMWDRRDKKLERHKAKQFAKTLKLARDADERSRH